MHRQLTEALVPLLDARDLPDRIKARITSSFSFCTCSYAAVSYGLRASGSGVIASLSAFAFRSSLRNFSSDSCCTCPIPEKERVGERFTAIVGGPARRPIVSAVCVYWPGPGYAKISRHSEHVHRHMQGLSREHVSFRARNDKEGK